ncbi:MmyB family transcriptional regulator [Streptomyces lavendulae]
MCRVLAGTDPDASDLTQLVGELLLKSPDFAKLWDRYDVTGRKITTKTFQNPQLGKITLDFQGMSLEGTPGHRLSVYMPGPEPPDRDAMPLLDTTAPHTAEPAPPQQRGSSGPVSGPAGRDRPAPCGPPELWQGRPWRAVERVPLMGWPVHRMCLAD